MTKNSTPLLKMLRLDRLVEHPQQTAFFPDLNDFDLRALADEIGADGLQNAIEVLPARNAAGLPAYTILRGHQRRRALQLLGYEEFEVLLMNNLVDADRGTIDLHFMRDNLNRRQLSLLSKARAALAVFELERQRSPDDLSGREVADARDRVAKSLNLGSGRNLQRYLNVLGAPLCIQQAFEANQISLVVADRISRLPQADQDEIAERMAAGEKVQDVISQYSVFGKPVRGNTRDKRQALLLGLWHARDLAGRIEELEQRHFSQKLAELEEGFESLKALIRFAKRKG